MRTMPASLNERASRIAITLIAASATSAPSSAVQPLAVISSGSALAIPERKPEKAWAKPFCGPDGDCPAAPLPRLPNASRSACGRRIEYHGSHSEISRISAPAADSGAPADERDEDMNARSARPRAHAQATLQ